MSNYIFEKLEFILLNYIKLFILVVTCTLSLIIGSINLFNFIDFDDDDSVVFKTIMLLLFDYVG